MEKLLDVVDNLVNVPDRIADIQAATGSSFNNWLVVANADSRFHVRTNQCNDAVLVSVGYST